MVEWFEDVYYAPNKHGLISIGEVEWAYESHSFDLTAVWYHEETGQFYWGNDSGCSCPSPFQDITDKSELNSGSAFQVAEALHDRLKERRTEEYFTLSRDAESEVAEVITRVMEKKNVE